ncbi:MAG TPA: hypothetical protein VFJ82_09470 [Longimicrobium sp.]|nr:hypothetical protein [Longimicrobium sp.]
MFPRIPTMYSRNIRPRRPQLDAPEPRESEDAAQPNAGGRERITPGGLVTFINHELQALPQCQGLRVRAGAWELDSLGDGCNWSESSLAIRVTGVVTRSALDELRRTINVARERFDVFAPEAYLG